jgi:hypothetical protein
MEPEVSSASNMCVAVDEQHVRGLGADRLLLRRRAEEFVYALEGDAPSGPTWEPSAPDGSSTAVTRKQVSRRGRARTWNSGGKASNLYRRYGDIKTATC